MLAFLGKAASLFFGSSSNGRSIADTVSDYIKRAVCLECWYLSDGVETHRIK